MIVRDYTGELMQGKAVYNQEGEISVEVAEAMTIKESLGWIKEKD